MSRTVLTMGNSTYGTASSKNETHTCPVCFDEKPIRDTVAFGCGKASHRLCYECANKYVTSFLDGGNPLIKCYEPDCSYLLEDNEVATILGHGHANVGRKTDSYEKADQLNFEHEIGKNPAEYARCPRCTWVVARSRPGAAEEATCEWCETSFCTACSEPYHYRTSCAERRQLRIENCDWVNRGRVEYWKKDARMQQQAKQNARAEKQRIEDLLETEKEDEEYKAANCRHCPHCGRIVEKLGGCDLMYCGYDTDTKANVQNGCLEQFYWSKAPPYKAQHIHSSKFKIVESPQKPEHLYWNCDACHKPIVGLRFECIHCKAYNLCEHCEVQHWNSHAKNHTFRIHSTASGT